MGASRSYFDIRYLAESKCHSGMNRSARAWAGANKGMDYFSRRRKLERARFYPYLFLPSDYFSRHKVSYERTGTLPIELLLDPCANSYSPIPVKT